MPLFHLSFQLLHDVMDSQAKKLSIQLSLSRISEDRITKLHDLLRMHKGDHKLQFMIYDNDEEIKLQMPSRKQKIKISQELLNSLEEDSFSYKLN